MIPDLTLCILYSCGSVNFSAMQKVNIMIALGGWPLSMDVIEYRCFATSFSRTVVFGFHLHLRFSRSHVLGHLISVKHWFDLREFVSSPLNCWLIPEHCVCVQLGMRVWDLSGGNWKLEKQDQNILHFFLVKKQIKEKTKKHPRKSRFLWFLWVQIPSSFWNTKDVCSLCPLPNLSWGF